MNLQLQCASEICADDYQNEDGENANDLPNDRTQQQQQQRRANNFKRTKLATIHMFTIGNMEETHIPN